MAPTFYRLDRTDAEPLLPHYARRSWQRLQHAIPRGFHSLFDVEVTDRHISGLRLNGDATLQTLAELYELLGMQGKKFRHHDGLSITFREAELFAILRQSHDSAPTAQRMHHILARQTAIAGRAPESHYEREGSEYVTSMRLDYALAAHPLLPIDEVRLLRNVAAHIPAGQRGSWVVHITRNEHGKAQLDRLQIEPNMASTLLADGALKPAADLRRQGRSSIASNMEVLGIIPHFSGIGLKREHLLRLAQIEPTTAPSREVG